MSDLRTGRLQDAYTGVRLYAGQDDNGDGIEYFVGSNTGNVLEMTIPGGTRSMALAALESLKKRGYKYQPFESTDTYTDPAIEIGDGVTVNGTDSIIVNIGITHSSLMSSNLNAPFDEEVDHEFEYVPRTEREFKREAKYARSRLTLNEDAIEAEVYRATESEGQLSSRISITADSIASEIQRATQSEGLLSSKVSQSALAITTEVTRAKGAEGNLSSQISQTADAITAEVTRAQSAEGTLSSRISQNATDITAKVSKTGGAASSFAWTLTDSSWILTSNNSQVLKATSSGIEISGKITATSGYIGTSSAGFAIDSNNIKNGMTSRDDTEHSTGIYIGTDGIALGGGKFKVTSSGGLTAKNGYIGDGTNGFAIGNRSISNGMTGRDDTANNGIYLGTNGIALGAGKFKVTDAGVLTATSGTIGGFTFTGTSLSKSTPDVSTDGQSQYQIMLQAPTTAGTSNAAIVVRHRTYNSGAYGSWENDFSLTYGGNLTANSGVFKGTVQANKIAYGGDNGYLNGGGITEGSIGNSRIIDGTILNGKIHNNTIENGKIYDGTLQTGKMVSSVGTSLGYANFSNDVFNNNDTAAYVKATNARLGFVYVRHPANNYYYEIRGHTHYFTVDGSQIKIGTADITGADHPFDIADTQFYKDGVSEAESTGYSNGYGVGYNQGSPAKVTGSTVIGGQTYYYIEKNDGNNVLVPYNPN